MSIGYKLYGVGTAQDVTQTYYVYIRREADGLYFDADTDTFVAYGALVAGRIACVEDADINGQWNVDVAVGVTETGTYSVLPFDGLLDRLLPDSVQQFTVVTGDVALDVFATTAAINHNYGGEDLLLVTTEDSVPLEGADVLVYTKAAYDLGDLNTPYGATTTGADGRWVDSILVNRGVTYTVFVQKPYVTGPTTHEIIVP